MATFYTLPFWRERAMKRILSRVQKNSFSGSRNFNAEAQGGSQAVSACNFNRCELAGRDGLATPLRLCVKLLFLTLCSFQPLMAGDLPLPPANSPEVAKIATWYKIRLPQEGFASLSPKEQELFSIGYAAAFHEDRLTDKSSFAAVDRTYRTALAIPTPSSSHPLLQKEGDRLFGWQFLSGDEEEKTYLAPIAKNGGRLHNKESDLERLQQTLTLFEPFEALSALERKKSEGLLSPAEHRAEVQELRQKFTERMLLRLISHDMDEGLIFPWVTDEGQQAYYKIYKHLVTRQGFYAYLFVPLVWNQGAKPSPELFLRGSQFHPFGTGSLLSIQEDMRSSPGKQSAEQAQSLIQALWKDPQVGNSQHKLLVTGMSLSGSQTMYLVSALPYAFKKVTTYCSPGISLASVDTFNRYFLDHPEANIEIVHYRNYGDIIDVGGEYFLGYEAPTNVKVTITVRGFTEQFEELRETLLEEGPCSPALLKARFLTTSPTPGFLEALTAMIKNHGTEFGWRPKSDVVTVSESSGHEEYALLNVLLSPRRNLTAQAIRQEWLDVGFPQLVRSWVLSLDPFLFEPQHPLFDKTEDYTAMINGL